jgi:hypothetical protein
MLTSDRNFQNSCEAYLHGGNLRVSFYGLTREELLANPAFVLGRLGVPDISQFRDWEAELVVTSTKRIRMGLGAGWARGPRRRNEYGDLE